jgi:hypothetical protein
MASGLQWPTSAALTTLVILQTDACCTLLTKTKQVCGALDDDVPTLKDNVSSDDSHDIEFKNTLDAMFDDCIWPHSDSLSHISLPDEHSAREWRSTSWSRETVPSTYSPKWLPVWDERDEDARFRRNTKDPKVPRSSRH